MFKKLKLLFISTMTISFLTGCGEKVPESWQFGENDFEKFQVVDSELCQTSDSKIKTIKIRQAELLDEQIDDDDFFVFDFNSMSQSETKEKYYTYHDFSSHQVKVIKKEVNYDDFTLNISFEGSDEGIFGAIFNKDATLNGNFILTIPESNILANSRSQELDEFEKRYLNSPAPTPDKSGYVDLVSYFGLLNLKKPTNNEVPVLNDIAVGLGIAGLVVGIVGILVTIGNWIWSAVGRYDTTNLNNMNEINGRLTNIDKKLNGISTMLKEQFAAILIQADKTAIESYTNSIGKFNTDYVLPIGNFYRNLQDDLIVKFRDSIKDGGKNVALSYLRAEDGYLYPISRLSTNAKAEFTTEASLIFEKSAKYLNDFNRVDEGLVKSLKEDIVDRVKTGVFPSPQGVDQDTFASDIFNRLLEDFLIDIISKKDKSEIQNFRNLVINYITCLYANDVVAISKYVNRCKLSYNFGYEARQSLQTTLATSLYQLDRNAVFAQTICRFSAEKGIDEAELTSVYLQARKYITDTYKEISNIPDNYCFRNNAKWEAKLFAFKDKAVTINPGWKSTFSHSLVTKQIIYHKGWNFGEQIEYNKAEHPWVDSITLKTATARYFVFKNSGEIPNNLSLLDYFRKVPGMVNPDANRMIEPYAAEYHRENVYRFMGDFSTRVAEDKDNGKKLQCTAKGDDPHNAYFTLWSLYGYKGSQKVENWRNGTFYTADTVNADSGAFTSNSDLLMYCDYLHYQSPWVHAENYAFSGAYEYYNPWAQKTLFSDSAYGIGIEVK